MHSSSISLHETRALAEGLRERNPEIVQAVLVRVTSVKDAGDPGDLEYVEGLRSAVPTALEYGICAIEEHGVRPPAIPPSLRGQARLAARNAISLDTVMRRYVAGYALLGDFVIETADADGIGGTDLQHVMRGQAAVLDRLLVAVAEEYAREESSLCATAAERRALKVQRLLAGELLDTSDIPYDFEAGHVGLIAGGADAEEAVRRLASALDCRPLLVRRGDEDAVSAWLGARRSIAPDEIERAVRRWWPAQGPVAVGEPGEGIDGWRLTHRQARAAWPIALREGDGVVRYANVALVASALQDDLLVASLSDLYLTPLEAERDGGETLKQTLRAYLAAECNVSSAAARLGVSRRTVANRLRVVEKRVGRSIASAVTDIDAALRLDDIRRLS